MTRNPEEYPRRVFLATIGKSPAVLTETLWALQQRTNGFVPTEIHCVTTTVGEAELKEHFLEGETFHSYCKQFGNPSLFAALAPENIHVVQDNDGPLENIQTREDNARLADLVVDLVRDFTKDDEAALHVSIAGGRKTMTFLGGYVLSIFAREQDRLSHVLVDPRFEADGFFFPPAEPTIIELRGQQLNTKDANVVLADIPFLRLRSYFKSNPLNRKLRYSEVVDLAQRLIDPPHMVIDVPNRTLVCQGIPVSFNSAQSQFALALYLAERILGEDDTVCGAIRHEEFLDPSEQAAFRDASRRTADNADDRDRLQEKLEDRNFSPLEETSFLATRKRINDRLEEALGDLAERYKIHTIARRPAARGFRLSPEEITILPAKGAST